MVAMGKKSVLLVTFLLVIGTTYWFMADSYDVQVVYAGSQLMLVDSTRAAQESNSDPSDDGKATVKVACQFPDFDPFNPNAMKYYQKYPTTSCPNGLPTITWFNGEEVKVNQTLKVKKFGQQAVDCWYRTVTYRTHMDFVNGEWQGPFKDAIKVTGRPEYVEVQCTNSKGNEVSRMHHYSVRKEERRKLTPPKHKIFDDKLMNIILLGVDSLASHLFKRAMPKTRNYLIEKLQASEMTKYNKVGDNTFPNLLAITAGVYSNDLKNWTQMEGFDAVPFLWKQYKTHGYATQYMSDRPDFDEFTEPPTDSFNLPMLRALMKEKIAFNNNCFEDQIEVKLWLGLILEFARESLFQTGRFISVGMIKRPTHDFPNQASAVDEHYYQFFKELHETGLLNNTFLVFFGDHGPRMNDYRRTFYGSIEERAANMVIYVPPWFKAKYPTHYKNLLSNRARLTTNFDIHETVLNILTLPETSSQIPNPFRSNTGALRALSLFSGIQPERTCDDASVTPHMCMCNGGVSVSHKSVMQEVGEQVVKDINALLQPKYSDLCMTLKLNSVTSLALLNGEVGKTAMYRVMFTTSPGDAMFEATVQYTVRFFWFTKVQTLGLISRINMYRGQSDCVDADKTARMYCYCKDVYAKQSLGVIAGR